MSAAWPPASSSLPLNGASSSSVAVADDRDDDDQL
uniref:Uncharacterized protein n=1 Tax=Zea mays TaxID=4577 RepID=C4J6N7_MAIZE|nr:unknown [Zea mays]